MLVVIAGLLLLSTAGGMGEGWARLLAVVLIFVAAVVGIGLPWLMQSAPRLMALGNALSGGVMLAVGESARLSF